MQLNATKRETLGKKAKKVRKEQKIPAVIFGPGIDSIPITLDHSEFLKSYRESGETALVDVVVEGTKEPYKVLVKEVQVHPVNYAVTHVGFYKVNLMERTSADIPVVVENEEDIALVKSGEALVLTQLNEITVSALPTDLPREFVLDVEITEHAPEDVVASLDYATIEEEPEEEVAEEDLIEGLEATEEGSKEGIEEESSEGSEVPSEE